MNKSIIVFISVLIVILLVVWASRFFMGLYMAKESSSNMPRQEWTEYDYRSIEALEQTSDFLVREGIKYYYETDEGQLGKKIMQNYSTQLFVNPIVDNDKYFIARFLIKSRGFQHDVMNFYREEYNGNFYEFWVVNILGYEWTPMLAEDSHSIFYVTKTDNIKGERKILEKSDQFISSFKIEDKEIFFPTNDATLYYLKAWKFPNGYKNSDLDKIEILLKQKDVYERVRID